MTEELKSFIQNEKWTYAKTYPKWPHEYIVREKVDVNLFDNLANSIMENGYIGKFYNTENTYFDYNGHAYWVIEDIINRCLKENSYENRLKNGTLPEDVIISTENPMPEDIADLDKNILFEKYKPYYDTKQKEYEKELMLMGKMEAVNRDIPAETIEKIQEALDMQKYIIAKTEANPHQYCLRKNWTGKVLFDEALQIIRDYGYVEWFWKKPYMILNVGEFKYWTMGFPLEVTILINRTKIKSCTREELLKV